MTGSKLYIADVSYLKDPGCFAETLAKLPAFRRERVLSYKNEQDRRRCAGVWRLLEYALREQTGQCPDASEYAVTEYGKPYLKLGTDVAEYGKPNLQQGADDSGPGAADAAGTKGEKEQPTVWWPCFSLAHSGDLAVVILSDTATGVDVEQIRTERPAVAKRFFHPAEAERLRVGRETSESGADERKEALPENVTECAVRDSADADRADTDSVEADRAVTDCAEADRAVTDCAEVDRAVRDSADADRLFTEIWTQKEAWLKAVGSGLHRAMDSFNIYDPETLEGFRLESYNIVPGYILSAAYQGEKPEPVIVDGRQLLHLTLERIQRERELSQKGESHEEKN